MEKLTDLEIPGNSRREFEDARFQGIPGNSRMGIPGGPGADRLKICSRSILPVRQTNIWQAPYTRQFCVYTKDRK